VSVGIGVWVGVGVSVLRGVGVMDAMGLTITETEVACGAAIGSQATRKTATKIKVRATSRLFQNHICINDYFTLAINQGFQRNQPHIIRGLREVCQSKGYRVD
jgi:hypothetical protein